MPAMLLVLSEFPELESLVLMLMVLLVLLVASFIKLKTDADTCRFEQFQHQNKVRITVYN